MSYVLADIKRGYKIKTINEKTDISGYTSVGLYENSTN